MALKYGIFAGEKIGEVNGIPVSDRAVDEEFLARKDALLYTNGVFFTDSTRFQVIANGGLSLKVMPGDIIIDGLFAYDLFESTVTLPAADPLIKTVYAVGFEVNHPERCIKPFYRAGTNAGKPVLRNDADAHDLCLAYTTLRAGATEVTAADIEDVRQDKNVCGIVGAAIVSPSADTMFLQQQALLETLQRKIEAVEKNDFYASVTNFTATLPAAGWSATAPYTQTVAVQGMVDTMEPICDIVLTGTAADAAALEAYACVSRIASGANSITATCLEDKPGATIDLKFKVVR